MSSRAATPRTPRRRRLKTEPIEEPIRKTRLNDAKPRRRWRVAWVPALCSRAFPTRRRRSATRGSDKRNGFCSTRPPRSSPWTGSFPGAPRFAAAAPAGSSPRAAAASRPGRTRVSRRASSGASGGVSDPTARTRRFSWSSRAIDSRPTTPRTIPTTPIRKVLSRRCARRRFGWRATAWARSRREWETRTRWRRRSSSARGARRRRGTRVSARARRRRRRWRGREARVRESLGTTRDPEQFG